MVLEPRFRNSTIRIKSQRIGTLSKQVAGDCEPTNWETWYAKIVDFLVYQKGIEIDKSKAKAISELPTPTNKKTIANGGKKNNFFYTGLFLTCLAKYTFFLLYLG